MWSGRGERLLALLTVVLGSVLCWLLMAIQQYAFDEFAGGRLPYVPDAWFGAYESLYERLGAARGLSAYYFWGRFAVLVYLAALIGALALPSGSTRVTRWGRRLLLIAICVGLVGDVLAYWGGTGSELTTLTSVGFGLVEIPGLLLMVAAMVLYGVGLLRERRAPALAAWPLIAGGVLALPGAIFLFTYVPHGLLLTMLAAMAVALLGLVPTTRRSPT